MCCTLVAIETFLAQLRQYKKKSIATFTYVTDRLYCIKISRMSHFKKTNNVQISVP